MSHNFTQPEEIDHILMAGHDMETDMPISDGAPSGVIIQDDTGDKFAMVAGFHTAAHRNLAPQEQYVRNM